MREACQSYIYMYIYTYTHKYIQVRARPWGEGEGEVVRYGKRVSPLKTTAAAAADELRRSRDAWRTRTRLPSRG